MSPCLPIFPPINQYDIQFWHDTFDTPCCSLLWNLFVCWVYRLRMSHCANTRVTSLPPTSSLLWRGVSIPHAWSFASHYPVWSKLCVWCTSLIYVSKRIMSERELHIVLCAQVSIAVSMRVKAPAAPLITTSNSNSAGCNQDIAGWVGWWSFLASAQTPSRFQKLSFTWVCSLSFHSLNALFENCLTVRLRATLCIQTNMQAFRHKTTCADFRTRADTDITMHTSCSNWDMKLRNTCSMASRLWQYSQQGHLMRYSQGPPPAIFPSSSNVQSRKWCWISFRRSVRQGYQESRVEPDCLYNTCVQYPV